MTAQVRIFANELPNVLVVPVQAVVEKEGKHYAYVADRFRGIERRDLEVGETDERYVQIKSGLGEGERVILDAHSRLAAQADEN